MPRDYKNAKRSTGKGAGGAQFFIGLGVGLVIAIGVHIYDKQAFEKAQRATRTDVAEQSDKPAPASQSTEPQDQLEFYEMLPKLEVAVPEKGESRAPASPRIEKPGAYILQAGSYRNFADADRIRAMLALQGVESKVSKVTIDADTWHQVRIEPMRDLKSLEETRRKLREAQIDAIVLRAGD
jgi:cell division protein FtsN